MSAEFGAFIRGERQLCNAMQLCGGSHVPRVMPPAIDSIAFKP